MKTHQEQLPRLVAPRSISYTEMSPSLSPNQIFDANSNYDTPELKTVEPLLTRFVRIYPERATPAGMGLRLELLGCEIEGVKTSHIMSALCLRSVW